MTMLERKNLFLDVLDFIVTHARFWPPTDRLFEAVRKAVLADQVYTHRDGEGKLDECSCWYWLTGSEWLRYQTTPAEQYRLPDDISTGRILVVEMYVSTRRSRDMAMFRHYRRLLRARPHSQVAYNHKALYDREFTLRALHRNNSVSPDTIGGSHGQEIGPLTGRLQ